MKTHRSRKGSVSPLSAHWTLYKPEALTEELNKLPFGAIKEELVDKALEKTGFNKAVRIRETIIKQKCSFIKQVAEMEKEKREVQSKLNKIKNSIRNCKEKLALMRDVLRIPREKPHE